jgi:hypothetical protein
MQDPNIVDIYTPFDGQRLIDYSRTLWEYDAELLCWVKIGPVDNLPMADDVTTGLLTAALKQMLDKIPEHGGAFNIVVKPFLSMLSSTNPDGLLRDKVNLTSDSLDIGCQDQAGNPITGKCVPCTNPSSTYPAITMELSEEFLKTLCIQTTTAKGPKGETGDRGDSGKDGTGDGPQGDTGDPGKDAAGAVKFAGIEIVDVDDVYDSAVTAVEVDQNAGKLAVTKARVRAPDSNTPATQLITTQVDRAIAFTRGFEYSIQKPPTDASETDLTMVAYPQGFKPDGTVPTQINAVKLSKFLDLVVADYRTRLTQIDLDYSQKVKEFILAKDAMARDALNELACKLSEAEWNLPVETCLGWTPADCLETGDQQGNPMPLAGEIFGGDFCEDSVGFEVGRFTVPAGAGYSSPAIYVTDQPVGSSTMAPGGYIISYVDGSYYDPTGNTVITIAQRDINGNIIGYFNVISGSGRFVGPALEIVAGGVTTKFPAASVACKSNPEVEAAYDRAPFNGKAVSLTLTAAGQIMLRANVPVINGTPIDSVVVRVFRVLPCPTTPPPGST